MLLFRLRAASSRWLAWHSLTSICSDFILKRGGRCDRSSDGASPRGDGC